MTYITAIKTAVLFFPFVAFIFTTPFILHQYHKYGSINKLRVLIIYSFILYLICIYFLVILPLPNIDTMPSPTKSMIKIIPFSFIVDIIKETSFRITKPATYLKALLDPCIYTVILNIIMTIPFGIYLRYYFQYNKKKIIKFTFLLSLFFELTQLTRLYFIYPYQYRIFDIDDLITNTFGGFIGYYVAVICYKFLPTREELDRKSYIAGKKVSGLRRITLFCLDSFIYTILSLNLLLITGINKIPFILFIIYYIVLPLIMNHQTFGSKFLNIKVQYNKYNTTNNILRILFLYLYYLGIPIFLIKISIILVNKLNIPTHEAILFYFIILCSILIYLFSNIFYLIRHNHIYYDNLLKTKYISTIQKESDVE